MRNVDQEYGVKKQLEREQEALERKKKQLQNEIDDLKKQRRFTEKIR